jgi:hypothetical protein
MELNNEILNNIKAKIEEIKAKKKAMIAELRVDFPQLFETFFEQNEWLNSFGWTQYTQYWNDGEETSFYVCADDDNLEINGERAYDQDWYDCFWNQDRYKKHISETVDIAKCKVVGLLAETINSISSEFYRDLFGDHIRVTITRGGGIQIDSYEDHD